MSKRKNQRWVKIEDLQEKRQTTKKKLNKQAYD